MRLLLNISPLFFSGGSACGNTQAWYPPDSCNGCLSQCNPTNVGMRVTFCP